MLSDQTMHEVAILSPGKFNTRSTGMKERVTSFYGTFSQTVYKPLTKVAKMLKQ